MDGAAAGEAVTFDGLKRGHYGAILADPPWRFRTWDQREAIPRTRSNGTNVSAATHYGTMPIEELQALPISELATSDCSLFLWCCWPNLLDALSVVDAWGFEFKTAAFVWTKAHAGQLELFQDDIETLMGMGYWTRANSEPCLLATRGRPKRINADVRQAIIAPRREHSRKPDGIHERIERLVAGPYLELFARQQRPGWDCWGNEVDKFAPRETYDATDDFARSIDDCYAAIRARKANGGKGWGGWE
jgi:N6-adenosine-specific RNA methylase IME4